MSPSINQAELITLRDGFEPRALWPKGPWPLFLSLLFLGDEDSTKVRRRRELMFMGFRCGYRVQRPRVLL